VKKRRSNNKEASIKCVGEKGADLKECVEERLRDMEKVGVAHIDLRRMKQVIMQAAREVCGVRRKGDWRRGSERIGQVDRDQETFLEQIWRNVWSGDEVDEEVRERWKQQYRQISKQNRRQASAQRRRNIMLITHKMEENMEDFWKDVNDMMGRSGEEEIVYLRGERGRLEEENSQKLEIMRKHYRQLGVSAGEVTVGEVGRWEENADEVRKLCEEHFTVDEWRKAVGGLKVRSKTKKGVTAEMLKCLQEGEVGEW
jgi:hypothetical protein